MHAVKVDTRGEQIRSACQPERRQKSTIGPAPQPDARRVDIGTVPQVEAGAFDIVELARSRCAIVESLAEIEPITNTAAIVNGKHDESLAGQVLVHGVSVAVVVH